MKTLWAYAQMNRLAHSADSGGRTLTPIVRKQMWTRLLSSTPFKFFFCNEFVKVQLVPYVFRGEADGGYTCYKFAVSACIV